MRAIFLDKDGTLVEDVPYNVNPGLIELTWHAGQALQLLQHMGYALFVVSNQSGVAKGLFTEAALDPVHQRLTELLAQYGVELSGFYYCPHSPDGVISRYAIPCTCRKPLPGMLYRAAHEHDIDLSQSWMIGDILHDVEAGRRAGCQTILIDNGNETEWKLSAQRTPHFKASDLYAAAAIIADLEIGPRTMDGMDSMSQQL
ncbi:D-glycero-alpha-D-manno-heptose-1,7-bisphosphate 7-phosphatase [Noviherbaspirillum sp. Root189]|uniref:D-glycero-alpha-D-manno-heptose-1,7-bisphosphate 7-phosphatase n=1 Tax=Noviherbaspirillum sp. Root189 TaxID=1736487 RepID=UPI00070DB356|nr:HAD family hydrolase [Noviherbaspirillum sp. Root189]KRB84698.1 HAD family hydrolase [Noviherbaspirillum sp. Root189]